MILRTHTGLKRPRRIALLFAILIVAALSPHSLSAQSAHYYLSSPYFGPTLRDSTECKTLTLASRVNDSIIVRNVYIMQQASPFTVTASTDTVMEKTGDSVVITVCFSPDINHTGGLIDESRFVVPLIVGSIYHSVPVYDTLLLSGVLKPTVTANLGFIDAVPTLIGGTLDTVVRVTNNVNRAVSIVPTVVAQNGNTVTVSPDTLNLPIAGSGDISIHVAFDSVGQVLDLIRLRLVNIDTPLRGEDTIYFRMTGLGVSSDSAAYGLGSGQKLSITFRTAKAESKKLTLFNGQDHSVRVESISITSSTGGFGVQSLVPLPTTLMPGDGFETTTTFAPGLPGFYSGYLSIVITAPTPLEERIGLQGELLEDKAVSRPDADAWLSVSPNPTANFLTVSTTTLTNTRVSVIDVLGREVARARFDRTWTWNTRAAGVPAGAYLLRVTGVSNTGGQIVLSRNISVSR